MKRLSYLLLAIWGAVCCHGGESFRVAPYLQRPGTTSMTVVWFSTDNVPGEVRLSGPGGFQRTWESRPQAASALAWQKGEKEPALPVPFRHVVELDGLQPGTVYRYRVKQSGETAEASFDTAPAGLGPVRLAVFGDSETEPESTGAHVVWKEPGDEQKGRLYPLDQTDGLAGNLKAIAAEKPDLLVIAGDLVQTGGEQRDWEEFWRQIGPLAASVPIVPALGNHDYYGGSGGGGYEGHAAAVAKYLTYFLPPDNGAANPAHHGRYYRLDYGAAALIVLDTNNGADGVPEKDTNLYLTTPDAPDFNPGSPQAAWLEKQLAGARQSGRWRFVTLHQMPWSCGPHGRPSSLDQKTGDPLSGIPVRALDDLFLKYGVAALFGGHDEMYERSAVTGRVLGADGSTHSRTLQVYDVGIAGDGLRAPFPGVVNPHQVFLAHRDSPEEGTAGKPAGGKHYGHLLVDVSADRVTLTPMYVLPDGTAHAYDDIVTLRRSEVAKSR